MLNQMIKNLKEVIISPSTAFLRIAQEDSLKLAFWVVCLSTAILCLPEGIDIMILGAIFIVLLHWQFETGILHLLARLLGARGKRRTLLIGDAYAMTPMIYLMPLTLIGIDGLTGMIGFVWSMCLRVLALKAAYAIGTGKAVLMLVLFCIIIIALCVWLVFSGMFDGLFGIDGQIID